MRDFVPVREGRVGIYLCGATVQAPPHVGHIRSGVAFDVVQRWLVVIGAIAAYALYTYIGGIEDEANDNAERVRIFKIVQDMASGLSDYMDEVGFKSVSEIVGRAVPTVSDWRYLNLNHVSKENGYTWGYAVFGKVV